MTAVKTLNFTLGENFGLLITQIAQEKILCDDGGFGKAINVLSSAMPNAPYEIMLDVLEGRKVLESNDGTHLDCVSYNPKKHSEYRQMNALEEDIKVQKAKEDELKTLQKAQNTYDASLADIVLDSYISSAKEIDKTLSVKNYKSNSIEDINDAGWLSPKGDWYGLNGQTVDMLHNQIADKLQEIGIIPDDFKGNPDQWLNEEGWMRITKTSVLFDGYYYDKPMINLQREKMILYAKLNALKNAHPVIRLGFNEPISYNQIELIEPLQFKLKWFKI